VRRGLALSLAGLVLVGCANRTGAERGEQLFSDPGVSGSSFNVASCATCHATGDVPAGRILSGGTLRGVLGRPSYWGGAVADPREAIGYCLFYFMRDPMRDALAPEDPRGLDLLDYLETLGTEPSPAVPFTVPRALPTSLPPGDAARGEGLYAAACATCHGAIHTGAGRASPVVPVIPDETIAEHMEFADDITIAKIRHGGFYGIGGAMPPFSVEVLDDQGVADVLAHLGL
jgi:thiosulfate dehydrogenase